MTMEKYWILYWRKIRTQTKRTNRNCRQMCVSVSVFRSIVALLDVERIYQALAFNKWQKRRCINSKMHSCWMHLHSRCSLLVELFGLRGKFICILSECVIHYYCIHIEFIILIFLIGLNISVQMRIVHLTKHRYRKMSELVRILLLRKP